MILFIVSEIMFFFAFFQSAVAALRTVRGAFSGGVGAKITCSPRSLTDVSWGQTTHVIWDEVVFFVDIYPLDGDGTFACNAVCLAPVTLQPYPLGEEVLQLLLSRYGDQITAEDLP